MRFVRELLTLIVVLVLLALAAQLTFRTDLRDRLRAADTLFLASHYHDARIAYRALAATDRTPAVVFVRLGMVATIRGEANEAVAAFATALGSGLAGDDYELTRLYQGVLAARIAGHGDASTLWAQLPTGSVLIGQRHVLEGEYLLRHGDYPAAEAALRMALDAQPPVAWRATAPSRTPRVRRRRATSCCVGRG